ncbi:TetR/AcrR family transcriptional regulator [Sabulicella glaciei]|uniref:TetR/AcrR family transcriptional regulator n=1 Tax=Sabulicella glaciei TaxID=2984948 RepID=A0ABT3P2S8_9PROT|nr:TetR/AcrR family transcriptional regulator [Roseococcus sp. MDT2-1-1]MCW8088074.1 TetR/AcrR family transcriptional regulator [Roseococcus sp. MDT2-1-1]
MGKGQDTRSRILDVAEDAVLSKGFGGTSIEEIIAATGLTKSGFFYHFRDKNALARALLERYIAREEELFDTIFGRARELAEEPLPTLLLGLKLLAEQVQDLPAGHPGCLVAVSVYGERLFDREVQELNRQAALMWRARFRSIFGEVLRDHVPRQPFSVDQLADFVGTVLEGSIVMSKALREPGAMAEQILLLRTILKTLFVPVRAPEPAA